MRAAVAEQRDVSARNVSPDPLLEALIELARSAIANRRVAAERRATLRVVTGGQRRNGEAA